MKPGTIFVSHRAEYGSLVRELKRAIETTSQGEIKVVISEELPGAEEWRGAIKSHLQDAESLFLVYGAAYEDWSWCFYEAGYFAGIDAEKKPRPIYCIARPEVAAPGPLNDLQMVTDKKQLINALIDIYDRNKVDYDPVKLRDNINQAAKGLFRKLEEFRSFPRVYFIANEADFDTHPELPAGAVLKGDQVLLAQLFGIGREEVAWSEIVATAGTDRSPQERMFFHKWVHETKKIIMAARASKVHAPQTMLIARGGAMRCRFLLYNARTQGDGLYCCEFLVLEDVGGPALGLTQQQLALLTSIRMGYRFRYDFIQQFADDSGDFTEAERRVRIQDIPIIIENLETESDTRGNITLQDLKAALEPREAARIGKLVGYWPLLKESLYDGLGLSIDGKRVSDQGLVGPRLKRYQLAFEALDLLNMEFLSRCCARVSQMMMRSEEELSQNAKIIERNVRELSPPETRSAA